MTRICIYLHKEVQMPIEGYVLSLIPASLASIKQVYPTHDLI
jgi:hypothetical protein